MNSVLPLNGCDTFMLAMDRDMRARGSAGNICHLLVRFPKGTDLDLLSEKIRSHAAFINVSRLRLSHVPLRAPCWTPRARAATDTTRHAATIRDIADLERWILSHSIDVSTESPFGFVSIPNEAHGPSLLFYWHHSLCDAHGGEALVALVSSATTDSSSAVTPSESARPSIRQSIQAARSVKKHIFSRSRAPLARLRGTREKEALQAYHKLRFTLEETSKVDELSRSITGGMFPTALYLAATARACDPLFSETSPAAPFLVPVPHDIRRQTRQKSPLTNQVSFAFFRLDRSQGRSLKELADEVIEQLQETIAHRFQYSMLEFLRLTKRFPLRFLWRVIEHPSRGHPASFYFSDIGASLSTLSAVYDVPVSYATHYPPVLTPPGFTTVWSRYRGALEVTVCYDKGMITEDAISQFETSLRELLLGGPR